MAFPPLENFDHVVATVSIDFPINSKQNAPFHRLAYDYTCADLDGLRYHLRDVLWEDVYKLSASTAASEFCEWVQVGIDVYITHRNYQVKPHSFPWFSVACAAAIIHRNHFLWVYQQNRSSESKVKFRKASIVAKGFLKLPNLHMLLKQKRPSRIANSFVNRGKSVIPPLFNGPEVFSSASDKAKLFAKNFLRTTILMTLVPLYLFSLLELM